jgi:hypothetical protein
VICAVSTAIWRSRSSWREGDEAIHRDRAGDTEREETSRSSRGDHRADVSVRAHILRRRD